MNELGNTPADKNYKPSGISKAEEAALKTYPKKDGKVWTSKFGSFEFDGNYDRRKAYQEGYEQAEKETIESVCKWLEEHFVDMSHYSDRGSFGRIETTDFDSMEEMVNDLKKALEEQK